ncbi:MAG: helix-turn-helix domain-containing protein [Verrucomicrobia bacterium]|nr:helix-turn-helix domain-containing protein [Verrucomicrobiota bacterium]
MRTATVADAGNVILGLQDKIRRSQKARYDHRLHGVLLVARGMNCCQVAQLLGEAPRTVAYWVQTFEQKGLAGLQEEVRSGRPAKFSPFSLIQLRSTTCRESLWHAERTAETGNAAPVTHPGAGPPGGGVPVPGFLASVAARRRS